MKKELDVLMRVPDEYVGTDCLQIMAAYKNNLMIYSPNGFTYFKNKNNRGLEIKNTYIDDERRKLFPYSGIPEHIEKKFGIGKFPMANQILDFEVPYVRINDGIIYKVVAFKRNHEGLVYSKVLSGLFPKFTKSTINREQLENYLRLGTLEETEEEKYEYVRLIDLEATLYDPKVKTEEAWLRERKEELIGYIEKDDRYYPRTRKDIINAIKLLNNLEPFNIIDDIYMLKVSKNKDIIIECIKVNYLANDKYELKVSSMTISVDNWRTDIILSDNCDKKIIDLHHPIIKPSLNPLISIEEIEKEKTRVRS